VRGKHESDYLQKAWRRHGAESFEFTILELCEEVALAAREVFYVRAFNSGCREFGYNLSIPTGRSYRHSRETKEKISRGLTGRIVPPSVGRKIADALRGRCGPEVPFFGKHHSEKTKQFYRDRYAKDYIAISPAGKLVHIKGLKPFCVANCLNRGEFHKVLNGKARIHKGWTAPTSDQWNLNSVVERGNAEYRM